MDIHMYLRVKRTLAYYLWLIKYHPRIDKLFGVNVGGDMQENLPNLKLLSYSERFSDFKCSLCNRNCNLKALTPSRYLATNTVA